MSVVSISVHICTHRPWSLAHGSNDRVNKRANEPESGEKKVATSKLQNKKEQPPAERAEKKRRYTPSVINIVSSVRDKLLSNQAESTVLCCHSILLIVIVFSNMNVYSIRHVRCVCVAACAHCCNIKSTYICVYVCV